MSSYGMDEREDPKDRGYGGYYCNACDTVASCSMQQCCLKALLPLADVPADADILAGALTAAESPDKPPVPAPPTWEVYETIGSGKKGRVIFRGTEVPGVLGVKVECAGPGAPTMLLTVELMPDALVQLKGAAHSWKAVKGGG